MFKISRSIDSVALWFRRVLTTIRVDALVPLAIQKFSSAHRLALVRLWQTVVIIVSLVAAFSLRFDLEIPETAGRTVLFGVVLALVTKTAIFQLFGIERGWWRFSSVTDLARLSVANASSSAVFTLTAWVVIGSQFPRSVYFIDSLICFLILSGTRFSVRLYHELAQNEPHSKLPGTGILIYGAGVAGLNLVREIRSNPNLKYRILGFLDDDSQKWHSTLLGVPVVGCGRDVARIIDRYRSRNIKADEIVIAMPSASSRQISEALANCRASGVQCKTIPSLGELLAGRVHVSEIREISLENLLGREPVHLEHEQIRDSIVGRSVMVTGAAGSIGSELCRQLLPFKPRCLVALDQAESDLFRLDMELSETADSVQVCPVIGDIRNYERVNEVIKRYGVTSVYHAAAYKHVPMMENNLIEAATNNVLGLYNVVQAASRNGVSSFVMISSDKAVNPTNIMGLTKRVSELVVSSMPPSRSGISTRFVSVRFGNVLGSNGSVVPIFKAQIAAGGPVTITHPEMRRYFMTIPEAVQLVLQASIMGKGSEIFVLDMGKPVRILDLARNMIRLSGREPDLDIQIRFVGPRPGEKLFEELSLASDQMRPTYHEKIMVFGGQSLPFSVMQQWITQLRSSLAQRNEAAVLAQLKEIVPEYQPSERWTLMANDGEMRTAVGA